MASRRTTVEVWTCNACGAKTEEPRRLCDGCGLMRGSVASPAVETSTVEPREPVEPLPHGAFLLTVDVVQGRRTAEQAAADLERLKAGQPISAPLPVPAHPAGQRRRARPAESVQASVYYGSESWWQEWARTGIRPPRDWRPTRQEETP